MMRIFKRDGAYFAVFHVGIRNDYSGFQFFK